MRKIISLSLVLLLLASFASSQSTKTPVPRHGPSIAAGSRGVVVSGKPAATAAGIKIWEQGGNAADANLVVKTIFVDGGRVLKRMRPAPQGRG